MPPPAHLEPLCAAFVHGLDAVLGDKVCAVYLYGAITFPEADASGDVDYHVIVREPLSGAEKAGLKALHAGLARDYPPAGADMDGYYLLLDDARRTTPPVHQFLPGVIDHSWALHCAHIRAGRYIRLCGPDPTEIYPAVTWAELEDALWQEHDFVAKHLTEYPDYCILNLCRLIYSFRTGDVVVSKRFSAGWAKAAFPQWSPLIDGAVASYERGHPKEDQALLAARIAPYYEFAMEQIQAAVCMWHWGHAPSD
jgi:hypothetical protein